MDAQADLSHCLAHMEGTFSHVTAQNAFDGAMAVSVHKHEVHCLVNVPFTVTLVTTTAFVPKDVANRNEFAVVHNILLAD